MLGIQDQTGVIGRVGGFVNAVEIVTKYFGKKLALDGVSMVVHHQDIYGFLGPSGYGVALTVIDLKEQQPVVIRVVRSKRIFPIAIGELLLLLLISGAMGLFGGQMKLARRISAAKP